MSVHASTERLSLYLDAALGPAERRQVEDHLEACPDCRHRLDGLHRVVAGLGRLPAAVPPDDLAARVGREIDLRGRRRGWARLFDVQLKKPLGGSPPIHVIALVLALGAIVYLFAFGVDQHRGRPTRIVLPAADAVVPATPRAPATAGAFRDRGRRSDRLRLLGGVFREIDGVWVEEGLTERLPDERLALMRPLKASDSDPELTALAELGAPLRLRVGERVVEIELRSLAAARE